MTLPDLKAQLSLVSRAHFQFQQARQILGSTLQTDLPTQRALRFVDPLETTAPSNQ